MFGHGLLLGINNQSVIVSFCPINNQSVVVPGDVFCVANADPDNKNNNC